MKRLIEGAQRRRSDDARPGRGVFIATARSRDDVSEAPRPAAVDANSERARHGRDGSVQGLRGLAVLLLVAGHVYGLDAGTGLAVTGDTIGRHLTDSVEYLRMPLFTVISGYVYALRPVGGWPVVPSFLTAKSRRLLLPLVPLTLLVGVLQIVSGASTNTTPTFGEILRGYVYGYSHLWFLEALFLVMVVVAVLDATGRLDSARGWLTTVLLGCLTYVLVEIPPILDVFRLSGALLLFPFFLLGYGFVRYGEFLRRRAVVSALSAVFVVGVGVQQALLLQGLETSPVDIHLRALAVVVGLGGTALLFHLRRFLTSGTLGWIGAYAFPIYLLHTMAAASTRVGLGLFGVEDHSALFVAGMAAAILLPIAFERLFGRFNPVRVVLLGEKPLRPRSPDRDGSAR